jgi:hypothetical protein
MKRSSLSVQCDLFSSVPTLPTLATLELHHDELVELLSRLLWEVAHSMDETMTKESRDEQDQS